jgi:Trypsin
MYTTRILVFTSITFLFFFGNSLPSSEMNDRRIIIRHDKKDVDYQKLALRFQKSICHLNIPNKGNIPDREGTLIKSDWVITAAHCAFDIDSLLKKQGIYYVTIMNKKYKVKKVIIHPKWFDDEAADIALLQLFDKVKGAKPVKLYRKSDELNQILYIAGKGDKGNGNTGPTGNDSLLRAANNRIDEATEFWLKYNFDDPSAENSKATDMEGISGPGDSGNGGFIIKNNTIYLAGIGSGQSTRNTGGKEGVYGVIEYYVMVSKYVNWIDSVIKNSLIVFRRIQNK